MVLAKIMVAISSWNRSNSIHALMTHKIPMSIPVVMQLRVYAAWI